MKKETKWKNQSIVIVNSKAKMTRPVTLEVLLWEKKLKWERWGGEDNINSELAQEKSTDINNRDTCLLCNRPVKTGLKHGICDDDDGFITNMKEPQRKEYLQNTHKKHTTYVKKTRNRSN